MKIKLLYLQFKSAIKNLQQQEANIAAETTLHPTTSVNFFETNYEGDESEVLYTDPEFIFYHNVESHDTTDVKQKARDSADLYEQIWRLNPKNNNSTYARKLYFTMQQKGSPQRLFKVLCYTFGQTI